MAYEDLSATRLERLKSGQLVDIVEASVKALTGVDSSGSYGGIVTRDNAPNPEHIDDVGTYTPGVDSVQDIDPVESLTSRRVMARKGHSSEGPRKYHAIIEYGNRYRSAAGDHPLHALARLTLATVSVAAKSEGAPMHSTILSEGRRSLAISEDIPEPVWTLQRYDDYINDSKRVPDSSSHNGDTLAEGLTGLLTGNDLELDADVCIVVSDFVQGAQRSHGQLTGFSWLRPLRQLHSELGDRLLVTRLTTAAQRQLPVTRAVSHGGNVMKLDTGDYLRNNGRYALLAAEKDGLISQSLRPMRTLQLDASDMAPLATVPAFIFGRPELATD